MARLQKTAVFCEKKRCQIGRNVAFYRKCRRYTQKDLAKLIGISITQISRIEKGRFDLSMELFLTLAEALKITPSKLLYICPQRAEEYYIIMN